MSFILDALRKSENERQRQSPPGLVDAAYRPPARRRNLWAPLLVAVLAANLLLMLWLWQREPPVSVDAGAPAAAEAPPLPLAPTAAPALVAPSPALLAAEAPVAPVDSTSAPENEYAAAADLPALESAPATADTPPPLPSAAATGKGAASAITEGLPSAEQMTATGVLPGPALHIDLHAYSSNPAERFVFINMRKYTEGMQLTDSGPRLEEITPEGAVFSQNGQRFQLARD